MTFKTRVFMSSLVCIFGVIALLITSVEVVAMCRPFYKYAYENLNTAAEIGMSNEDLMASTDVLLDYLQDKTDSIKIIVEVNGKRRYVFDERETTHMVDVKNLYESVLIVRNGCAIFALIVCILLLMDDKKGTIPVLTYTYKRFIIYFALFLGTLITYAACDFTRFWTNFHYLFFDNDLWLLDPRVSIMINMFPEPFFFAMVFAIAALFAGILIVLWIYSILKQKKLQKV